jgi:hypothetical protein
VGIAAVLVIASGCTTPSFEAGPVSSASPTLLGASPTDPLAPVVRGVIDALVEHVRSTRDGLAELATNASLDEVRDAAATASRRLTADERFGTGAEPDERPLLPGPVSSREEVVDYNDLFTDALTAAREVGGDRLLGVLSDPIAGDLGAWQRDPDGVYETVEGTITDAEGQDLAGMATTVAALDGQALRALAWAELATKAGAAEAALTLARRAVAHLDIVLGSLESLADPGA